MTRSSLTVVVCSLIAVSLVQASAQMTTTPATSEELEAIYTRSIEGRAQAIIEALDLSDAAKAARVHDVIISQYRALRARDAVVDQTLIAEGKDTSYEDSERVAMVQPITDQLHKLFLTALNVYLTPDQIEIVKDRMTYNRVAAFYDEYCVLLPNLKEADKTKILEALKAAREQAIDGGSRDEKFTVFENAQKKIDQELTANGYDVQKARAEKEAKRSVADAAAGEPGGTTN